MWYVLFVVTFNFENKATTKYSILLALMKYNYLSMYIYSRSNIHILYVSVTKYVLFNKWIRIKHIQIFPDVVWPDLIILILKICWLYYELSKYVYCDENELSRIDKNMTRNLFAIRDNSIEFIEWFWSLAFARFDTWNKNI